MDVTVTLTVPVGHPVLASLAGLLAGEAPAAPATAPQAAPAAPKAGRGRKAATAPAAAPAPAQEAEEAAADSLTLDQVKGAVNATLKALGKPGVDTVQGLLKSFKVGKLTDLDAKHYDAFVQALNEAQAVVG